MQLTVRPRHGGSRFVPLRCTSTNQVCRVILFSKVWHILVLHINLSWSCNTLVLHNVSN